jgi:hypothetical protein
MVLFLLFPGYTHAQKHVTKRIFDDDIPEKIVEQFQISFPGALKPKWYQEEERFNDDDETPPAQLFYKVIFKLKKVKKTSVFDSKGNLMETVTVIKSKDLPAAVSRSFSENFKGYGFRKLRMIEKGHSIMFEADVFESYTLITCIFDSNGQLIEKVKRNRKPRKIGNTVR